MSYVYGPVLSRRLGPSLGIDPIPFKTCNWNCVYCQLGRSVPLRNERHEYVKNEDVLRELGSVLGALAPGQARWVTFSGSGEPTLHSGLGGLIRGAKALTPLPIAVVTNGALLSRSDVRDDLLPADAVLPTLDAGSEAVYRRINRPAAGLTFAEHLDGLRAFRHAYSGQLWVEVMLVRGINDDDAALDEIGRALEKVRPDAVHVNQPVRPPAEPWTLVPDPGVVARATALFGRTARAVPPAAGDLHLFGSGDVDEAVLAAVSRHPMAVDDVVAALSRWDPFDVRVALDRLAADGRIRTIGRLGRLFWTSAAARYGGHI
jgi:wyosine [tRNA(Phe)-imidazoG37] synthetase (radical SAM superfamily)